MEHTLKLLILSAIALSGCHVPQTIVSDLSALQSTMRWQHDSIMVRDSSVVHIRADTVWMERWHTSWREREQVRTDTVYQERIRTETVSVPYVPRFYKWCAATLIGLLIIIVGRCALRLWRPI